MGYLVYIVFWGLVAAAIWYFLCGVKDEAKKDGDEKSGCIVCIIVGLISAVIAALVEFL